MGHFKQGQKRSKHLANSYHNHNNRPLNNSQEKQLQEILNTKLPIEYEALDSKVNLSDGGGSHAPTKWDMMLAAMQLVGSAVAGSSTLKGILGDNHSLPTNISYQSTSSNMTFVATQNSHVHPNSLVKQQSSAKSGKTLIVKQVKAPNDEQSSSYSEVNDQQSLREKRAIVEDGYKLDGNVLKVRTEDLNLQTLIAQLAANPNVTTLDLANNNILSPLNLDGIAAVGKALKDTKITTLLLGGTDIGLPGVRAILPELKHTSVTTLSLYGNGMLSDVNINIESSGIIEFVKLLKDTNITTLDIGDNNIGYEGAKTLIPLLKDTKVTTLGLGHNKIGSEEAKAIIPLLKDTKITTLNLDHNEISEDILREILDVLEDNKKNTVKESTTTDEGYNFNITEEDFTTTKEKSISESANAPEEATSINKIIVLAVSGLSFLASTVSMYIAYKIYKKLLTNDKNLATPNPSESTNIPLSDTNDAEYEPVGLGSVYYIGIVQELQGIITNTPDNNISNTNNGDEYEKLNTAEPRYIDMKRKLHKVTVVPNNLSINNDGYEAIELTHCTNKTKKPQGIITNTPVYNNILYTNDCDEYEKPKTAASHYINFTKEPQGAIPSLGTYINITDGNEIANTTTPLYINSTIEEFQGATPLLGATYVNIVCES